MPMGIHIVPGGMKCVGQIAMQGSQQMPIPHGLEYGQCPTSGGIGPLEVIPASLR